MWRCSACGQEFPGDYSRAADNAHMESPEGFKRHEAIRGAAEDSRPDYWRGVREGEDDYPGETGE